MEITRHAYEPPAETLRKALIAWFDEHELPGSFNGVTRDVTMVFPDKAIDTDYRIVVRPAGDLAIKPLHVSKRLFYPVYHISFFADNQNLVMLISSLWMQQCFPGATQAWEHMSGLKFDRKTNLFYLTASLQIHRKFCPPAHSNCFPHLQLPNAQKTHK